MHTLVIHLVPIPIFCMLIYAHNLAAPRVRSCSNMWLGKQQTAYIAQDGGKKHIVVEKDGHTVNWITD